MSLPPAAASSSSSASSLADAAIDVDNDDPAPWSDEGETTPAEEKAAAAAAEDDHGPPLHAFTRSRTLPSKLPVRAGSYLNLHWIDPVSAAAPGAASAAAASGATPSRSPSVRSQSRFVGASPMTRPPVPLFSSPSSASFATPTASLSARSQSHFGSAERPPLTHRAAHDHDASTAGSLTAMEEQQHQHHGDDATQQVDTDTDANASALDTTAAAATEDESMPPSAADVAADTSTDAAPLPPALTPRVLVGPVIGKVSSSSVRILVEVNVSLRLTVSLTPQSEWVQPRFEETASVAAKAEAGDKRAGHTGAADSEGLQSPLKKQRTASASSASSAAPASASTAVAGKVHTLTLLVQPFHPTVFSLEGLEADTIYLASFAPALPDVKFDEDDLASRTGLFRTHPLVWGHRALNVIAFSCDCASELGRDRENLWVKLYNDYCCSSSPHAAEHGGNARFDLMVHLGDQVYADAAFARGEVVFGVAPAPSNGDAAEDYSHLSLGDKLRLVCDAYAEIYRHTWSDSPTRLVLATGSHLMQWDDHEIRNDWGSFAPTATDLLIAGQARKAFHLYQRALWDAGCTFLSSEEYDSSPLARGGEVECSLHVLGSTGVVILDNRACRTWDPSASLWAREDMRALSAVGEDRPTAATAAAAESESKADESMPSPSSAPSSDQVSGAVPHAHAYFGGRQWEALYSWIRPPAAVLSAAPTLAAAPSLSAGSYPSDSLTHLIVVNPSPALFLGSAECDRLRGSVCLIDKLGLGLHPEEQASFVHLFEQFKFGGASGAAGNAAQQPHPKREVLFVGGDSHFAMRTELWRVDASALQAGAPDPRLVGSGSPLGPGAGPAPVGPAVKHLWNQILASAISSRRPKPSSFELWRKSLFHDHVLKGRTVEDSAALAPLQPSLAVGPYYLTHSDLTYSHNFAHISCTPATASAGPSITAEFILSGAHDRELQAKQQEQKK